MKKPKVANFEGLTDEELTAEHGKLLEELARRRGGGGLNGEMSDIENALEVEKATLGASLMNRVLDTRCALESAKPRKCGKCGGRARVEEKKRSRTVRTLSGEHTYRRNYYRCSGCGHGFAPVDDELGIPADGTVTLEVEKRIADFGVNDVFASSAARFTMHYGWSISENLVRRVVDRVADVVESLPEGQLQEALLPQSTTPAKLLTIGLDGSMLSTREGWQETKVGVIVRDEHHLAGTASTRGAISRARYITASTIEETRERLWAAAVASGVETAEHIVLVSDGAPWIRALAEELFPQATLVLDWPHVVQHLMLCGKALLGEESPLLPTWARTTTMLAWEGRIDELLSELEAVMGIRGVNQLAVIGLLKYLRGNRARMNYPEFLERGLPTGSGIAESAHRHVLQVRMKRAGQHWSPTRMRRMARLRAAERTAGPHFASRLRTAQRSIAGN